MELSLKIMHTLQMYHN